MAQPTAPFCEDAVRAETLQHLAQFPHVSVKIDPLGNVIAHYQRGDVAPRWVLSAHMDHPGFVQDEFLGGVPERYLQKNPPRRSFGAFDMWDLPAFEVRDGCIYSRACDDLIGCAVMIAVFSELEQLEADASVFAAFTCAEEVGLLGAVYLARSAYLPKELGILSIETSSERPPAKMHDGVIVRTGDRSSVFDPGLVSEIVQLAVDQCISHQRCLMSGGTCEATAYRLYGHRVAGVCVALGNYHNCGPQDNIAAEYVSVSDVREMVRLCVAVALQTAPLDGSQALRSRLEQQLDEEMVKRDIN
jgi:endoglucanase